MKTRASRERGEAALRLRRSNDMLRELEAKLKRAGHRPGQSYWIAKHREFWDKLRFDKRIAQGEI